MPTENKTLVSEADIQNALKSLEGWEYDTGKKALRRVWQFQKFVPTMKLVRTPIGGRCFLTSPDRP